MSLELKIKLNKNLHINDLCESSSRYLSLILMVEHNFNIVAVDKQNEIIGDNENITVLFNVEGYENDIVELTTIYQYPVQGYEDPEEDGWWAYTTIRAAKDAPMKYALSAALAIAIAKMQEECIIDEEAKWSIIKNQSCDNFMNAIKLSKSEETIDLSLKAFLTKVYSINPT